MDLLQSCNHYSLIAINTVQLCIHPPALELLQIAHAVVIASNSSVSSSVTSLECYALIQSVWSTKASDFGPQSVTIGSTRDPRVHECRARKGPSLHPCELLMHGVALSSCWLAVRKTCWNQPQRSNARLRVDVRTLQVCFSQRTMSFVYFDVFRAGVWWWAGA